jgi:hypothetical protein
MNRLNEWCPAEWEPIFRRAGVALDKLDQAKSKKSKSTHLGNFLAQHVGREVEVEREGRTYRAKLCVMDGRARSRRYYFEIIVPEPDQANGDLPTACAAVDANPKSVAETDAANNLPEAAAPQRTKSEDRADGNDEEW